MGKINREDVIFSSVRIIEIAHEKALTEGGGSPGVRDRNLVESAVHAPETGYYYSLAELAAVYAHGINKNHPFIDGNKRTSLLVSFGFLDTHGHPIPKDPKWEEIIIKVATGEISRDELTVMLSEAMGGDVDVVLE